MDTLIWFIPLPPLIAFFAIVLYTNPRKALSHSLAVGGAGVSWLLSMIIFIYAVTREELALHPLGSAINWLPTGGTWLQIGARIDPLSAVTLFFVAWTVLAIFVYSIGYHNFGQPKGEHDRPGLPPHGATLRIRKGQSKQVLSIEPLYSRFFALLSLFAFAMLVLVISDNLLTLYIGWEVMGFCSYALIGFWYAKESARDAAVKAFLTTRVGDVFMLLGLVALYSQAGTLSYAGTIYNHELVARLAESASGVFGLSWAGLIAILLFIGVVGKSAQFPLHVWLPDAMEGPTPVSAMIHAAAMVSAGVYLAIRIFPLATAGWSPGEPITAVMTVMATIGAFTALFAATIAMSQNDIKRVLAYSTISQLGYMIAALGVGAYAAAAFHLFTHAFFKALLFLGSGSVIHGMEHGVLHTGEHIDPQDMRNMGGLKDRMPRTFWTFVIGGMSLAGLPLVTAGFWSKDEILAGAFNSHHLVVFLTLALAALLTAFYTTRQISMTFLGAPRTSAAQHAHETGPVMTIPLIVLSVFAIAAGWVGIPHSFPGLGQVVPNLFEEFLAPMLAEEGHGAETAASLVPLFTSLVVSLGGIGLGYVVYRSFGKNDEDPMKARLGVFYQWMQDRYYVDQFYDWALVRPARWISEEFTYRIVDRKIIDGFLEWVAAATLEIGRFLRRYIDVAVVNLAGDKAGQGTRELGVRMRPVQSGRVQQYMVMTILLAIVAGMILFYFLVTG